MNGTLTRLYSSQPEKAQLLSDSLVDLVYEDGCWSLRGRWKKRFGKPGRLGYRLGVGIFVGPLQGTVFSQLPAYHSQQAGGT